MEPAGLMSGCTKEYRTSHWHAFLLIKVALNSMPDYNLAVHILFCITGSILRM